jgi:hypothetical protein
LSSMGGLIFQERGGSPLLTLEDEPHGCQEVATWVKLGKVKRGGYSKFRYLHLNNFAILTLFRA